MAFNKQDVEFLVLRPHLALVNMITARQRRYDTRHLDLPSVNRSTLIVNIRALACRFILPRMDISHNIRALCHHSAMLLQDRPLRHSLLGLAIEAHPHACIVVKPSSTHSKVNIQ